jgi:hypothetical protein
MTFMQRVAAGRPCHQWSERDITPAELDRISDHELSVGHVARAEMLAWRAAELRDGRS